ncbi:PREDICTED: uncharacterized protein LOC107064697 [Polistes dominula]|uniref:Uncharacterized protein LOC107064697 n=1 Tax=Polistes dominula TaxID=743375 RepID=A0ABM1HYY7_POLDO|nr:PREDICTED: uncharacterized protein LOC107064697 [Polistes dominula]
MKIESFHRTMSRQSVVLSILSYILFVTLLNNVTCKVIPPSAPWASFASKSIYSRSLGPPVSGFSTISIPYMSKSPFFPKFIDPKDMISKKTDLLSNLFGGMGTVPLAADNSKLLPNSLLQYPTVDDQSDSTDTKLNDIAQLYGVSKLKSPLSSQETKRSATLLANDPEPSSKDTTSSDKTEAKDPNSSTSDNDSKSEESETPEDKLKVKEYLPGMFSPFVVDPSMFIEKKYSFLDTLFKNLATTTATPSFAETTAKSTIVPPEFWIPSSPFADPTEYNDKISSFLDKLFENLTLNKTKDETSSSVSGPRVARSIEDVSSILAAKDAFVDSILMQLSTLKDEMISVLNDTISYQKSSGLLSSSMVPKKPFLPSMWVKPTADTMLLYKQKMQFLDQMFDMLLELQKNVSANILETVKSELNTQSDVQSSNLIDEPLAPVDENLLNQSLLDVIKQSLAQSVQYPAATVSKGAGKKVSRSAPSATSFWVAYPDSAHTVAKRHAPANNFQYPSRSGNNFNNYPQDKLDPMEFSQKYDKENTNFDYDIDGQRDNIKKFKEYVKWMDYIMNERKEGKHRHHHHYF